MPPQSTFGLRHWLAIFAALCAASAAHAALSVPSSRVVEMRSSGSSAAANNLKTPTQWRGRKIYQVLTDRFATDSSSACTSIQTCNVNVYLGGTYKAMTQRLDYISNMGFDAIWITPIVKNIDNAGAYHGYWAADFFDVNENFGTSGDLTTFVEECHKRNIWVMLDFVVNHVGPVGTDYSQIITFPNASCYHTPCQVTQYDCFTQEVLHCRLADLPDLNQDIPAVKDTLINAILDASAKYGFDGLRADTVMYINKMFWVDLTNSLGAASPNVAGNGASEVFITGEVYSSYQCNQEYLEAGAVSSTLNYPLFFTIRSVFRGFVGQLGSMYSLGSTWRQQLGFPQPNWQVNFVDNHDNDRWLQFLGDAKLTGKELEDARSNALINYRSAIAYMYFTNGIPCVYYGTEQLMTGDVAQNTNREPLWITNYANSSAKFVPFFYQLNRFFDQMVAAEGANVPNAGTNASIVEERWMDATMYCLQRPGMPMLLCVSNNPTVAQTRTIPNLAFQGKSVCTWYLPGAGEAIIERAPSSRGEWKEGIHYGDCVPGSSTMTITVAAGQSPLILFGM